MNEYCNYCWAKKGAECICLKSQRRFNCDRARNRLYEATNEKMATTIRLRKYLRYINSRIAYLQAPPSGTPSNELKYYTELLISIKKWAKRHRACYEYTKGKIRMDDVQSILGISLRQCHRVMQKQRRELFRLISEKERLLAVKYPHESTIFDYKGG